MSAALTNSLTAGMDAPLAGRPPASGLAAPGRAESFAASLRSAAEDGPAGKASAEPDPATPDPAKRSGLTVEAIREHAEELVSIAFVQPILAQLRDTNGAAAPFAPGAYEKTFGPMLDKQIAQRITSAQRLPLVEALARSMTPAWLKDDQAAERSAPTRPSEDLAASGLLKDGVLA
jgi:hypothetical protein